jgi:hypothetical protein
MRYELVKITIFLLIAAYPGAAFAADLLRLARADNLPPYEEYKRQQENRANSRSQTRSPVQNPVPQITSAPAAEMYKFTDDYGITHYVESFDLVPPEYREQFMNPENDDPNISAPSLPQAVDVRELSEITISSAGLGPDWTRIDELVVFYIGKPPLIKNDALLLAHFQTLQNEYVQFEVDAWLTASYKHIGREREILRSIDVLYLIFKGQKQARQYRDLLVEGRAISGAGYKQRSARLRGAGQLRFLISISEGKIILRKLLLVQHRNVLAVIAFAPEDINHADRLSNLIDDFMKRSMKLH